MGELAHELGFRRIFASFRTVGRGRREATILVVGSSYAGNYDGDYDCEG